ncbi:hypothetical protein CGRA01v4_14203 [Colletotrichum graminicola]|nr:hypothetical protein CGRA01v4_14203 [Colletotrichum graminicola]
MHSVMYLHYSVPLPKSLLIRTDTCYCFLILSLPPRSLFLSLAATLKLHLAPSLAVFHFFHLIHVCLFVCLQYTRLIGTTLIFQITTVRLQSSSPLFLLFLSCWFASSTLTIRPISPPPPPPPPQLDPIDRPLRTSNLACVQTSLVLGSSSSPDSSQSPAGDFAQPRTKTRSSLPNHATLRPHKHRQHHHNRSDWRESLVDYSVPLSTTITAAAATCSRPLPAATQSQAEQSTSGAFCPNLQNQIPRQSPCLSARLLAGPTVVKQALACGNSEPQSRLDAHNSPNLYFYFYFRRRDLVEPGQS